MIAPLAKTGVITPEMNLLAAVVIGFLFGFVLQRVGFTDSRKIARMFYLKDIDIAVVMLSAIVTAALGLWGLALLGIIDTAKMYFLPTYLAPMAVGGVLFGIGMVVGGFCPGTAAASMVTGKIDAMVFIGGFFAGSLVFGDLFPVWTDFYASDFRGVWRLDHLFGINLGAAVLLVTVVAFAGIYTLHLLQETFWGEDYKPLCRPDIPLGAIALAVAVALAFFPTSAFIDDNPEPPYYIIQKAGPSS